MKYVFSFLTMAALLTVSYLPVSADPAPMTERGAKPVFLAGEEKIFVDFQKAPAAGSDVDVADLKEVLAVQASRTPAQTAEAMSDKKYTITLITDVIDPAFATKYPKTFVVLTQADQDEAFITTNLKKQNARPRPYEGHGDQVKPLFTTKELNMSFPSGHAAGTEVQAKIVATLFPAQAAAVMKKAQDVAESRVTAGVHYPSDIKAGTALGDLIFAQLEANAQFTAALAAAAKADNIPAK